MGFNRYLGFHFTDTCIYIAEARQKQDKHLYWDVPGKANYELEPEWMPLYKDAIPNLYDNQEKVYGFSALPGILRDFTINRYLRFDSDFLARAIPETITEGEKTKLKFLFRYCSNYINPQHDEKIIVTMITDDMKALQRRNIQTVLEQSSLGANLKFIDVIDPEEACRRFLWSENNRLQLGVEKKVVILLYMGYTRTLMIPLDHQELVNQSAQQAPGMIAVDRAVTNYAVRNGLDKNNRTDDELLLHAQLARRAFTFDQSTVRILKAELPSSTYQEIVKEKVAEVAEKLEKFIKNLAEKMKPVYEIFLVGEGAAFTPVVNAIRAGCNNIPMTTLQPANHASACGAASKSFFETNPDMEAVQ